MDFNPIILSIPIFFFLIGAELLFDFYQQRKAKPALYRWKDTFTNISCGIIEQATGVFAKAFTVGMYALAYDLVRGMGVPGIPENPWTFALCFVAGDFFYYWSHRLSHQVNLFWTGHVVHHQSEDYNLGVALRQGALQKVLMFWVYLPMAIVGFSPQAFVFVMAFNLLYQFWIHTEAVRNMGVFEWVLNTPSHHRVHHGRNPKYIDRNHAGVFIIWDRLFGTFQAEEEAPVYGITRPTETYNPVWAHVQPYARLMRDVRAIPAWKDRVRFLFKPPGWYPAQLGGPQEAPAVEDAEKFDWTIHPSINRYIVFQYVLSVAGVAIFLFSLERISTFYQALVIAGILWTLLSLGWLVDRRSLGRRSEFLRLIAFAGASFFLGAGVVPMAVLVGATIFAGILAVWAIRLPAQQL